MPRTKRHLASSSMNSNEDSGSTRAPNTSSLVPPIIADEHGTNPVQLQQVENTESRLPRGQKRSSRTWDVKIKDANGELKSRKMRAIDIFSLPPGERVVVEWNCRDQPVDSSGGMLAQFLRHIASNCHNFPIGFEKWQKIPECYKDHVWNNIIKTKMEVNDDGHKSYILKSLAKKWRDHRYNLYSSAQCDPDGPREANIAKKPSEIPLDQWVAFVDYRALPDTKAKAEKNAQNRTKLTMPHTLGSKSFARLEREMETQLRRPVSRAEIFQVSHTTSDGSFVNEEARHNHEELAIQSQNSSENEAFINVFGKEHPGYVRGLGLGVVPTQVYGASTSSSNGGSGRSGTPSEFATLKATVQQLTQQVQDNQHQIAFLTEQLSRQTQNLTPNVGNVNSPANGKRSAQDSHSVHDEDSSDPNA